MPAKLKVSDEQIVAMYQEVGGSGTKAATALGISGPSVYNALRRLNVPLIGKTGKRPVPTADGEIRAAYYAIGSGIAVADLLAVPVGAVYNILAKYGIETGGWHVQLRGVKGEDERRVEDLYLKGISTPKIAAQLSIPLSSVRSHLHRTNTYVSNRLTPEQKRRAKTLYVSGLTAQETAQAIGSTQRQILGLLGTIGLTRKLGKGESSPTWNGGRNFHGKSGYWYVYLPEDDPYASMRSKAGYVPEHRIVMARKLKRLLAHSETVHHIDGDKTNNAPENLQLRHGRHGKNIVPCCMDCGSRNIGTAAID